jgi:RecJ-like exonuclease
MECQYCNGKGYGSLSSFLTLTALCPLCKGTGKMEATVKKEVTIQLGLTLDEAKILISLVQNPICEPDKEEEHITNFRYRLFDTLKNAIDNG